MSPAVREHLEEILSLAEAHSIHRARIDWTAVKQEVRNTARGAQSFIDAEPAILHALQLLNDGHSFYQPAAAQNQSLSAFSLPNDSGGHAPSSSRPRLVAFTPCPQVPAPLPRIPENIGYVRVPGSSRLPEQDAEEIRRQVREADREGLLGWIIDLRGNTGGNMWPMLLGISPVLGEGVAGHFVEPDGIQREWAYAAGAAFLGGNPQMVSEVPYTLRQPARRIAVLIDEATVSSGEALVVAFRGRAGTRIFGMPTCGRSSVNRTFRLRNGALVALTVGLMVDRNGTVYGGKIEPDESGKGLESVERAISWLTSPGEG